jgi:hypothetical protein
MPELVIMEHVVLKWIYGKLTLKVLKLHPTHAQFKVNIDVRAPNAEIMLLETDTMVFVIKMDVISILID